MTKEQVQKEIESYNSTGKLTTHPHIICTKTGAKVTAFGSNLAGKIKKFGGLDKLLTGFVGRIATKTDKPVKIKKEKKPSKAVKLEELIYDIPKFVNNPPLILNLTEDAEACKKHTEVCVRPDIFLNWDRTCDGCNLQMHCQAPCKSFSKGYKITR